MSNIDDEITDEIFESAFGPEQAIAGSSMVVAVKYDPQALKLRVRFKGNSIYEYDNVANDLYAAMMAAPSKGTFFWENIRENPEIPYRRVS